MMELCGKLVGNLRKQNGHGWMVGEKFQRLRRDDEFVNYKKQEVNYETNS
jgi:hypothetical protein